MILNFHNTKKLKKKSLKNFLTLFFNFSTKKKFQEIQTLKSKNRLKIATCVHEQKREAEKDPKKKQEINYDPKEPLLYNNFTRTEGMRFRSERIFSTFLDYKWKLKRKKLLRKKG